MAPHPEHFILNIEGTETAKLHVIYRSFDQFFFWVLKGCKRLSRNMWGTAVMLIFWLYLKPVFFKTFWPRTMLAKFLGRVSKWWKIFEGILRRMEA
jgi:hypothetical protein